MSRYQVVRKQMRQWADSGDFVHTDTIVAPHPDQPADGFASAIEASLWCDAHPRCLDGSWYIRAVEASNG